MLNRLDTRYMQRALKATTVENRSHIFYIPQTDVHISARWGIAHRIPWYVNENVIPRERVEMFMNILADEERLYLPPRFRELNFHMTLRCVVRLTVFSLPTRQRDRRRDLADGDYERRNSCSLNENTSIVTWDFYSFNRWAIFSFLQLDKRVLYTAARNYSSDTTILYTGVDLDQLPH